MNKNRHIWAIVVLLILGGAYWYWVSEKEVKSISVVSDIPVPPSPTPAPQPVEPMPSGKIDEHLTIDNTLRDVNFCGETYKVKQVIIDGVDVGQRIAELATKDQSDSDKKAVCDGVKNYRTNFPDATELSLLDAEYRADNVYTLSLVYSTSEPSIIGQFDVNIATGMISFIHQGFAGYDKIPFGTLK